MQAELRTEGHKVSVTKLCRWLGIPRRTFYYQPKGSKKPLDEEKVSKIKEVIERFPSYGYRRIAAVLGWNRKVVQKDLSEEGLASEEEDQGETAPSPGAHFGG